MSETASRPARVRPPEGAGGAVVTVGTFDGVHRGHRAVLDALRQQAACRGARSVLVTFDPHPLRVVNPAAAPRLLTTPEEKGALLADAGLDQVAIVPFTLELSRYSPKRFVEEILIGRFGMTHLVIGYDHGFGRGRSGDVQALQEIGAELGFGVDVVPAVDLDGAPVSSTRIRHALEEGDVAFVARALGRPYAAQGTVVRGDGRGRLLGVPTANLGIDSPDKLLPQEGIYAVRARVRGQELAGVLHLGPRPTFPGATPTMELHLLDFEGDLYGQSVRVEFCARLRGIVAFGSVGELAEAMRGDIAAARRLFSEGGGACAGPRAWLE